MSGYSPEFTKEAAREQQDKTVSTLSSSLGFLEDFILMTVCVFLAILRKQEGKELIN